MIQPATRIVLVFGFVTGTVSAACTSGCVSCNNSTCISCQSSYYLDGGNCSPCPENCPTCDGYNDCTSCKPQTWGLTARCSYDCATQCLNRECQDDNGYCTTCKSGTYGLQCLHNCSVCKDGQCDLRKCTLGCKSGYFEYTTSTETFCQNCPSDCKVCNDSRVCNVCNDGFYLYEFISVEKIYVYCLQCPLEKSCKTCEVQSDSVVCASCNDGFEKDSEVCKQRVSNISSCSSGCSTYCDENGACLGSCNVGLAGKKCTEQCPSQCLRCNKTNAYLCEECHGDLYTANCDVHCSSACAEVSGQPTCRLHDGYCLNGCENQFWGPFCNISCSKGCIDDGMSKVCERDNGTCKHGCIEGYVEDVCEETMTTKETDATITKSKTNSTEVTTRDKGFNDGTTGKNDSNAIIIGAGVGGGFVLLILIVVLVLCCLKRRRKQTIDRVVNGGMSSIVDVPGELDDTLNAKANLEPQAIETSVETQEYIYAQPNKLKKAKKPSKKEISEPHSLYDNIAVDLEDEQVITKETNVDILQLENLGEGTISFIETEIKVPTTDTYYNTASLIRSRIQISNLLEYIKVKTDYEEEFEKLPKGLTRPCTEALKPGNISKNRFNGVYAYDATRVKLKSQNYINANYIDGHKNFPEYIASLGPTIGAMKLDTFWEMIWQEKTGKIIMLTHLEESGKMKCEQYWPNQGDNKRYSDYNVSCTAEKEFSEFVVREFNISRGSETRNVSQYHYVAWPDKTVPDTVASLMEFRDKVKQTQSTDAGPMVVHCSAGIGRTGTYIALDILVREGREEGSVDIFGRVAALRGQRAHMVQNPEQYRFLHHCIMYALTCVPQPLSKSEIEQLMTLDKISAQYQTFMELQITPRTDRRAAATHKSRKENRKGADIPGDENRVRLTFTKHDYINAVYLDGYLKPDVFIIAQTPLPNTVEDFVSMLYQEECPCVVCLDEEHIIEKTVGLYLPPANKVSRFGQCQVACTSSTSTEDFVTRELKISKTGSSTMKEVSVLHYQFRGWKGSEKVPVSARSLLNLVSDIKEARRNRGSEHPTVVHCLTGAKRSGLFCGVSILLEKLSVEKELSVLNTVCQVRCRRRSAFQDIEHLQFCYACVKETLAIPKSNIYYNA